MAFSPEILALVDVDGSDCWHRNDARGFKNRTMSVRLLPRPEQIAPSILPVAARAFDKPGASLHLVVHVAASAHAEELVREAHRLAGRLRAHWTALHLDAADAPDAAVDAALRLAEQLGGEVVSLPGHDIAGEILAYVQANNVRHIVIGDAPPRGWRRLFGGSVARTLLRETAPATLHVVPEPRQALPARPEGFALLPHLAAIALVGVAVLIGLPLQLIVSQHDIALLLLMAVLITARRFGLWPSITASVLSVAAYDFFFLPPIYAFGVADPSDVLTMVFFLAVALTVSNLTAQTRRQTAHLIERVRTISSLYGFSRRAVGIGPLDELLDMTAAQLAEAVDAGIVLLLPGARGLEPEAASPGTAPLDAEETALAARCWRERQPLVTDSHTALCLPLSTERSTLGVVTARCTVPLTPAARRLLDALVDQAAIAVERVRLAEAIDEARVQAETERLRNALLTSVSHDLRTPLAYIIGALSSLRGYGETYDPGTRTELLTTAQDEAERLDRYVGNLLDMTRLEAGAMQVTLAPVALDEVIGSAVSRARPLLARHRVAVELPAEPIEVEAGFLLLEQVLFNLLDNAAKYAPAGCAIAIAAAREGGSARISIADEGPGLPEAALETIFDRFTRFGADGQPGAGLGLAICRGFIAAMGGTLAAANRADRGGAIFTMTLKLAA